MSRNRNPLRWLWQRTDDPAGVLKVLGATHEQVVAWMCEKDVPDHLRPVVLAMVAEVKREIAARNLAMMALADDVGTSEREGRP